ncbi:hypothetical protein [Hymenobacter fodinae]|uniref:Uncharacterized protein n=1 Tax=Hymenobacter fodinae TaxID=2510796 RepID=A0A4Z0P671_9BACT|nr:hypothetical protein [Hymenobacter fodinae]TGE06148.1 hypothetical protein EU556_14900 [Hymenobacter fodinae]
MEVYIVKNISEGILLAILGVCFVLCFGGLALVPKPKDSEYFSFLFWLCFLGPAALGYIAARRFVTREQIIGLTDNALSIRSNQSTNEQTIPLRQIKSYVYEEHNNSKLLALSLYSGKRIKFKHNDFWGKDDFYALVADFKKCIEHISNSSDEARVAIQREPSFYEKPVATVMGWTIVVAVLLITGIILFKGTKRTEWRSILMVYGSALSYLGPWLSARKGKA